MLYAGMVLTRWSFGPNSFPAHNSVIFATEVQAEFIVKSLFTPIMNNRASIIEVRQEAEDNFTAGVQALLNGTVFSANCSNWYINAKGKNSASWPGYASTFWRETFFPRFKDFKLEGGSTLWWPKCIVRWLFTGFFNALLSQQTMTFLLAFGIINRERILQDIAKLVERARLRWGITSMNPKVNTNGYFILARLQVVLLWEIEYLHFPVISLW